MKRKPVNNLLMCLLITGFLLGIYRGRVALWSDDDPAPVKVFPIPASQLSSPVRSVLAHGIRFETLSDLQELMEKYLP